MTLSRNLSLFAETVDSSGKASLTTGVTGTLPAANGGTGVNNGSNTITLANTLTTAGNFPQTLTASAATNVTLPPGTSGNYVMSTATQMANNPVTGTPSSSNYLRGDGTWSTVANTAASYTRTTITATPNQTVFTVAYTSPYLAVYLNGVLILPTTDYTATNGTSVTLVSGAAAGDILDFLAYATGTIIQLPINLATSVTGTLPPSSGGTGTTGTPSNGQLLIGNGTTYSTASLTQGTGISVTNGSGSITLANTGVTALTTSSGLSTNTSATGAVSVTNTGVTALTTSSGLSTNTSATGAVSVTNTGVTSIVAGTNVTISGSTGAVTINAAGGSAVTSVATGNGLSGGTITSTGTLTIAAPSYNSVGSYVHGGTTGNPSTISGGGTIAAGGGGTQLQAFNWTGCGGWSNNLSGTWRLMAGNYSSGGSITVWVRVS
jgi:trimeric autotransporter adhesin